MSGTTNSEKDRKKALKVYEKHGAKVAAEIAQVSTSTISRWAKEEGIEWKSKPKARCGTRSGYQSGCRCVDCTEALRKYVWSRRRQNGGMQGKRDDLPEERHGQNSTYTNYGCRCEPCRAANSIAQKEERDRRLGRGLKF